MSARARSPLAAILKTPSLSRPLPELHFCTLGRKAERKLDDVVFYREPQYEFFRLAPRANPFVLDAEENPPAGQRIGRVQRHRLERSRTDEIHHLGVVLQPLLQLRFFLLFQFR